VPQLPQVRGPEGRLSHFAWARQPRQVGLQVEQLENKENQQKQTGETLTR